MNLLLSNYSKIGYSTTDVNVHLNKLYSMPIFYLLMTILGLLIMMKFTFIKTKFFNNLIVDFINNKENILNFINEHLAF